MITNFTREMLVELLRHALGTQASLADYRVANQCPDYFVLIARLNRPNLETVIKVAGPRSSMASAFDRTAMLHSLVAAQTELRMPETLAVNMDFDTWPWRYLVRTHIPGLEWVDARKQMTQDEIRQAFQQIGHAVARLHTIHFPDCGELQADGSVSGPSNYRDALANHARSIITHQPARDYFLDLLERKHSLFQSHFPASLCHEDLHQHNILFNQHQGQWRLSTILDFDKAWAGSPETDLARLEFWKGMMHPAFWTAYRMICSIDPLYEQRRPIYQLLWCFEYAQNSTKHLADTRRLCTALGVPLIDNFESSGGTDLADI